jgi:hypothetical protein
MSPTAGAAVPEAGVAIARRVSVRPGQAGFGSSARRDPQPRDLDRWATVHDHLDVLRLGTCRGGIIAHV